MTLTNSRFMSLSTVEYLANTLLPTKDPFNAPTRL